MKNETNEARMAETEEERAKERKDVERIKREVLKTNS